MLIGVAAIFVSGVQSTYISSDGQLIPKTTRLAVEPFHSLGYIILIIGSVLTIIALMLAWRRLQKSKQN